MDPERGTAEVWYAKKSRAPSRTARPDPIEGVKGDIE